jgi:hypothetical protein
MNCVAADKLPAGTFFVCDLNGVIGDESPGNWLVWEQR